MKSNKYLDLFLNLKIVSKLRAHDRLDTSQTIFRIHSSTYFIPLFLIRWWTRGNREHDVARIETLYKEASEFVHSDDSDEGERSQILTAMEQSTSGLRNICTTYDNDATIQSRVEVIIDNTERLLESSVED